MRMETKWLLNKLLTYCPSPYMCPMLLGTRKCTSSKYPAWVLIWRLSLSTNPAWMRRLMTCQSLTIWKYSKNKENKKKKKGNITSVKTTTTRARTKTKKTTGSTRHKLNRSLSTSVNGKRLSRSHLSLKRCPTCSVWTLWVRTESSLRRRSNSPWRRCRCIKRSGRRRKRWT